MIHEPTALKQLGERFGDRDFSAREAAETLPFTHDTTLVALSTLTKDGMLVRRRKGVYAMKAQETEIGDLAVRELRRPEIHLTEGYATGTYALSGQLSVVTAPRYIDIFVPLQDYANAVAAMEAKGTFPEVYVYPFAAPDKHLKETIDGLMVPPPEVAFVDLIKIAVEKKRPVNLEYEILPFIPQLVGSWREVRALAEKEEVGDYLEAVVFYVAMVAEKSGFDDINLPDTSPSKGKTPRTLSFTGGRVDEVSVETGKATGIVIEADQDAVRSVLSNL